PVLNSLRQVSTARPARPAFDSPAMDLAEGLAAAHAWDPFSRPRSHDVLRAGIGIGAIASTPFLNPNDWTLQTSARRGGHATRSAHRRGGDRAPSPGRWAEWRPGETGYCPDSRQATRWRGTRADVEQVMVPLSPAASA